jgi:hypothetical protein
MIIVGALGFLVVRFYSVACRALQVLWNEWIRYIFNKFAAIDINVRPKCQSISMNHPVGKSAAGLQILTRELPYLFTLRIVSLFYLSLLPPMGLRRK